MIKVFFNNVFFCINIISANINHYFVFLNTINIKQQKNKNYIKLAHNYYILNLHILETKFFRKRYKNILKYFWLTI